MQGGWAHKSVIALLEAHPGASDPEAVIRTKARALVERVRGYGWNGPPFDPELLAGLLGIQVHPANLNADTQALIRPRHGSAELEILWNSASPRSRRNFSIFHEIIHTLFPDCFESVRHRAVAPTRADPDRELERLCDIGAAELLMPHEEFSRDLSSVGNDIAGMDHLRDRYQSSREATAIRMMGLNKLPVAATFLSLRLKPVEERAVRAKPLSGPFAPKMRVDLMAASPSFPLGKMPKHKSIPDLSVVYDLADQEERPHAVHGTEEWPFREGPALVNVEASPVPPGEDDHERVVAFLSPA